MLGFGICCQFTITETEKTVTRNCTYVQNPEYPGTYEGTSNFNFYVGNLVDNICFVRVDFDHVELSTNYLQMSPAGEANRAGECMDILQFT